MRDSSGIDFALTVLFVVAGIVGSFVIYFALVNQDAKVAAFGRNYIERCQNHDSLAYCRCTWDFMVHEVGAKQLYEDSQNNVTSPEVYAAEEECTGL